MSFLSKIRMSTSKLPGVILCLHQKNSLIAVQISSPIASWKDSLNCRPKVWPKRPSIHLWQWAIIIILALSVQNASAQTPWSMAYDVPNGNGYQNTCTLDWGALTHIAFAGGAPQADGSVTLSANFASVAPGLISAPHSHNV